MNENQKQTFYGSQPNNSNMYKYFIGNTFYIYRVGFVRFLQRGDIFLLKFETAQNFSMTYILLSVSLQNSYLVFRYIHRR